jgi:hypothetical protein
MTARDAPIPRDILLIVTPVAPKITSSVSVRSRTLKVSGWMRESASTKATTSPQAILAPPFRAAAIRLNSTVATRQPRSRAISAVRSVDALSATMTSILSAPPP